MQRHLPARLVGSDGFGAAGELTGGGEQGGQAVGGDARLLQEGFLVIARQGQPGGLLSLKQANQNGWPQTETSRRITVLSPLGYFAAGAADFFFVSPLLRSLLRT